MNYSSPRGGLLPRTQPSLMIQPRACRTSSRSGGSAPSQRHAALALGRAVAIGWPTSWAIDAASRPLTKRNRNRRYSQSARRSRASFSNGSPAVRPVRGLRDAARSKLAEPSGELLQTTAGIVSMMT